LGVCLPDLGTDRTLQCHAQLPIWSARAMERIPESLGGLLVRGRSFRLRDHVVRPSSAGAQRRNSYSARTPPSALRRPHGAVALRDQSGVARASGRYQAFLPVIRSAEAVLERTVSYACPRLLGYRRPVHRLGVPQPSARPAATDRRARAATDSRTTG